MAKRKTKKTINVFMIDALLDQMSENASNLFKVGPPSWQKNKQKDLETIKRCIKVIREELKIKD